MNWIFVRFGRRPPSPYAPSLSASDRWVGRSRALRREIDEHLAEIDQHRLAAERTGEENTPGRLPALTFRISLASLNPGALVIPFASVESHEAQIADRRRRIKDRTDDLVAHLRNQPADDKIS